MLGSQALLPPTCGLGRALGSLLFRADLPFLSSGEHCCGLCHTRQDSALLQHFRGLLHAGLRPDSHGGHL